jgi:hypothetical protein
MAALTPTTLNNTSTTYTFAPNSSHICAGNGDNIYIFKVNVTDASGCKDSVIKKLNVVNPYVTGGDVQLCHRVALRGGAYQSSIIQVAPSMVSGHLSHGDYLANCAYFTGAKGAAPEPVAEEQIVAVYPNPTTGVFIVDLSSIIEQANILITDVQGKVVAMKTLTKDAAPTATFDLGNLARGMYLIQVRDGELNYRTKIVVQ